MGRKKGIEMEREDRKGRKKGIMTGKVSLGRKWWRLVGVYVNKNLKRKMEKLREWIENREEEVKVLIGGTFKARTGRKGGSEREKGKS